MKALDRLVACMTALGLCMSILCGCTARGSVGSAEEMTGEAPTDNAAAQDLFTKKDRTAAVASEAADIELNGSSIEITQEGTYRLHGSITDGCIRVVCGTKGTVRLLLDGVDVFNESGAALYTENCEKVILTLADGSENTLRQGAGAAANEDENAAITSRDDLTLNGGGALSVISASGDGINSRDTLKIVSGSLTVQAGDDGLIGKDAVIVGGGSLNIASGGDGLKATNDSEADKGYVVIAGGSLNIVTGGGSAGVSQQTENWGRFAQQQSDENTESVKGIKAETTLTISGGTLNIDAADDALHTNGSLTVSGGVLALRSGDDGMHSDAALTLSGGAIDIAYSYEGLEGVDIAISGGVISVSANDDGINAAGGDLAEAADEDRSFQPGRFGHDMFDSSTGSLSVTGGIITVNAKGDGVDINGSAVMSGGELYVRGPLNSGNGALDYADSFTMSGGTLVAVGASGMAQGISHPEVPCFMADINGSGMLSLLDENGTEIITFDAAGDYQSIVIGSDRLTEGQNYIVRTQSGEQGVTATLEGSIGFGGGPGGFHRQFPDNGPEGSRPQDMPSGGKPGGGPRTVPTESENKPPQGE